MPLIWLIAMVAFIAAVGFVLGRQRALASACGEIRDLHSLPSYYGWNVALKALVPAFGLLVIWLIAQPLYVGNTVSATLPDSAISEGSTRGLVMAEVRRTSDGIENAVAAGLMDEDFAGNARADLSDVTQRLKDAGQIVTSQITQPVLRVKSRSRSCVRRRTTGL